MVDKGGYTELGKSYFVRVEDYGKIIVDGKMLVPLKRDPDFEDKHGFPEIGACVKVYFDQKANSPKLEILKRVFKENQIVYG